MHDSMTDLVPRPLVRVRFEADEDRMLQRSVERSLVGDGLGSGTCCRREEPSSWPSQLHTTTNRPLMHASYEKARDVRHNDHGAPL